MKPGRWQRFKAELGGFVWTLIWPLRMLLRLCAWLWGQRIHAVRRLEALPRRIGEAWRRMRAGQGNAPVVGEPGQWKKRLANFLLGLPVLLCAGGLFWLGWDAPTPIILRARYHEEAMGARARGELEVARLCAERLSGIGSFKEEGRYLLALALLELEQQERGLRMMARLAPPDRKGYHKAHYWLASYIVSRPERTPEQLLLAEAHLQYALLDKPGWAQAQRLLAHLKVGRGDWIEAEALFLAAVHTRPEWRLEVAAFYRGWGRAYQERDPEAAELPLRRAREQAGLLLADLNAVLEQTPENIELRGKIASVHLFLEDYASAFDVLRDGLSWGEGPTLFPALADVCAGWSASMADDPSAAALTRRFGLLAEALQYSPQHLGALRQLLEVSEREGEAAEEARERLQKMLVSGTAPATLHFLLGNQEWSAGRHDRARFHMERAVELGGARSATVVNNLAYMLAHSEPADLARALELIDVALEAQPDQLRFHETRGRILAKLERWHEALEELERSSAAVRDKAGHHRILADVYQALGLDDLAALHREQASWLESP